VKPSETTAPHTRILKCALEVEDARAYWQRCDGSTPATAQQAFDEYWFGARSLARVEVLLANFRHRFDAFPPSLSVLHRWSVMSPDTRKLICHWHLQLADPIYRELTGELFPSRHGGGRAEVSRDLLVRWIGAHSSAWTMATRIQFASKLLSASYATGLVTSRRDPRPLAFPRVPDDALAYLLHLLRGVRFDGYLADNPYLRSVGIDAGMLADRLRTIDGIELRRAGELHDFTWAHANLASWANAHLGVAA
jgi:hypothetical protein